MNLNNRILKLEQQHGGETRYFLAKPVGDGYELSECKPNSESPIVSEQELEEWQAGQGENVILLKMVHPPVSDGFKS